MNLREAILQEHSKKQTDKIIRFVGTSQVKFDKLVELFLKGEYRVTQRAGWPLSYIVIAHPSLIKNHLRKLISNLEKPDLHNAVIRNTFRICNLLKFL